MGWASGSQLAEGLWEDLRPELVRLGADAATLQKLAEKVIDAFENHDADDWDTNSELWVDSGRGEGDY